MNAARRRSVLVTISDSLDQVAEALVFCEIEEVVEGPALDRSSLELKQEKAPRNVSTYESQALAVLLLVPAAKEGVARTTVLPMRPARLLPRLSLRDAVGVITRLWNGLGERALTPVLVRRQHADALGEGQTCFIETLLVNWY